VGTPVIANAQSRVLADHCRKANAGLYYGDFEEFEEVLTLLLNDRNLGRSLGRNGQTYVKDNYGWNRLLPKYELVFRSSARPAREPKGARARPAAVSATPHEPEHDHEPEDLVSTGDLPLLEPGPEEEPLEARPEELETALEDGSYSGERDTSEPEELAELAPEESGYEEEETALELAPEERQPPADARDSYRAPEPPDEEPYHEPAEEIREAAPQESPAADEGGLPAFYRPRLRPTSTPKGAPEPTKED
jgi:hypothetical protein